MQRNTTVSSKEKVDLDSINKGVELLMRRRTKPSTEKTQRGIMEQAIIALSVMVGILTLSVGLIAGYLFRAYIHDITPQYSHPEMYDENGNPLPDELIAFRFEGNPTHDDDD